MFLKKHYGVGYLMVMVKADGCDEDALARLVTSMYRTAPHTGPPPSPSTGCDDIPRNLVFAEHVPGALMLNNVGAEISFELPQADIQAFVPLFRELEDDLSRWGVQSFGVCQCQCPPALL
jgi:hypothetical protein